MKTKFSGFTLIELMIVIVIVGVLATIALPAYQDSVRKSRRTEALSTMLDLQLRQEKWRANNSTYGTEASIWTSPPNLDTSYYDFTITPSTVGGTAWYYITASALSSQQQDKQYGVSCATLTLNPMYKDVTPANPDPDKYPAECWRK